MSNEAKDKWLWLYRTLLGGTTGIIAFFVIQNYHEFQDLKRDSEEDKKAHAVQAEIDKNFDLRLTKVEQITKP